MSLCGGARRANYRAHQQLRQHLAGSVAKPTARHPLPSDPDVRESCTHHKSDPQTLACDLLHSQAAIGSLYTLRRFAKAPFLQAACKVRNLVTFQGAICRIESQPHPEKPKFSLLLTTLFMPSLIQRVSQASLLFDLPARLRCLTKDNKDNGLGCQQNVVDVKQGIGHDPIHWQTRTHTCS